MENNSFWFSLNTIKLLWETFWLDINSQNSYHGLINRLLLLHIFIKCDQNVFGETLSNYNEK